MSRVDEQKALTKRRLTAAARIALASTGTITDRLIADVCEQVGLHRQAFRTIFPTDDELLDAVNDVLVDEVAARLRGGIATFTPPTDETRFVAASVALAGSWPLDRGGMVIRGSRRLRALHGDDSGGRVVLAERRFVAALTDVLGDMITKLDRQFRWQPALAVRVILDTYERSFEAWLMSGGTESNFATSPYVQRTLPTLLEELSMGRGSGARGREAKARTVEG